jgi:hypothetical protein
LSQVNYNNKENQKQKRKKSEKRAHRLEENISKKGLVLRTHIKLSQLIIKWNKSIKMVKGLE